MRDIVNTLIEADSFKMLVSAIQAAELVDLLRDSGNFTVFAPDDEAFSKLPKGTFEDLIANIPKLNAVVMYHVVAGKLTVDQITQMDDAKTIQGQEVKFDSHKWHLHVNPKVNDANITTTDIETDNGMIHVLDKVLMPNMALTCPVCGMGFTTTAALKTHTKRGHAKKRATKSKPIAKVKQTLKEIPAQMSTRSSQDTPIRGIEPNQVPCPVCGKTFKTSPEMKRHMDMTHHESKRHD
jgi:uncharacterized C2H2 Zn-finger protein